MSECPGDHDHGAFPVALTPTGMPFGHDGSLDRATVERLVHACRPDWGVDAFRPAEDGTDAVYFVTVDTPDGPGEAVLKACEFVERAAFRPEPVLLRLFAPTPVPVPAVYGVVSEQRRDLPTPCFLMERRGGEAVDAADLPPASLDSVAREAGRTLAYVHSTGAFERFGPVRLRRDTLHDRSAVTVGGTHLTVAEGADERWSDGVTAVAEDRLAALDGRFADLEGDLRAFVETRLDAVDGPFDPVLVHHDYRPGNLLVDPETGTTQAVLDWGNAFTGERGYNLVSTEQSLAGRVPPGHPRRERVRTAMRTGYAAVADPPELTDRQRDLYLAVTHLAALAWFSEWHENAAEDARERDAAQYRGFVRTLL